ncbi:MAG: hypothetical protein KGZ63_04890 [Clostridiales bacterium]|nr:hypothetical protein [Clostridiales bacterium]
MDFEQWFKERTSGFERLLIRGAIFLLVLLFLSQALLTVPGVRRTLNLVDRLEGEPYTPVDIGAPAISRSAGDVMHYLELTLLGEVKGNVEVFVNGTAVKSFSENTSVVITVSEGDLVEIDGDIPEEELGVVVSAVSDGIQLPQHGRQVHFFGRPETIGWVVIKGD